METINNLFTDLGSKMPFATDFFASKLSVAGAEISAFFLVCLAAVVVLLALIVIIICLACAGSAKRKAAKRKAAGQTRAATREQAKRSDVLEEVKATEEDEDEVDIEPSVKPLAEEKPEEKEEIQTEKKEEEPQPIAEEVAQEKAPVAVEEIIETTQPAEEVNEEPIEATEKAAEPQEAIKATEAPVQEKEEAVAAEATSAPEEKNSDAKVAEEVTQMKKEEVKKETAKKEDSKAAKALVGTFEVSLCLDGYRFYLYASNKQLMYESVGFTSSEGAIKGIDTFRKTLQEYPYIITRDKYGRYRYVFNKRYQGENYTSAALARSAAESVKRWAENAKVIVRNAKPEAIEEYKKGVDALRTKDDVDWDLVAKEEKEAKPLGKFTVEEDGNQDEVIGYRFYLIANNAQILYTSAIYASAAGALKAIDTFKRAVYVGNFYVDKDKFGHFRYILRANATTTYVGESYTSRASAESSIESVKKFVKCAAIIPFKKGGDEA